MSEKREPREMSGAELKSMLKSSINFKSLGGLKYPELKLKEEDLKWWREAKFGMFIHWGLYSILGRGEWVMNNEHIQVDEYAKLGEEFKPKHFNADEWAGIAKAAGMKYMVMVTRHHDGFALWDSPGSYNDFTSFKTGAKRDFVKEYTQSCRDAGLKVGIYYSPMDWRFPGYFNPHELLDNALLMKKQAHDQVEELVSKYGPIDIMWYDGSWLAHKGSDTDSVWLWDPIKLNQTVRKYNSKTIINPRSGWEGDFYCDEGSHEITGKIVPVPWEKNLCICSGTSWGWMNDDPVMLFTDAITMLVNVFVRDGNVLLNVGPDKDGVIPEGSVERLKEIGHWMEENGESIYGTRGGPFEPVDRVYGSTYIANKIYIHIQDYCEFEKLRLPAVKQKVIICTNLASKKIDFIQDENGISISVPSEYRTPVDTIIRLVLDSDLEIPKNEEIVLIKK